MDSVIDASHFTALKSLSWKAGTLSRVVPEALSEAATCYLRPRMITQRQLCEAKPSGTLHRSDAGTARLAADACAPVTNGSTGVAVPWLNGNAR